MTSEDTAAALVRTITGVPGVRGIEPGIASALRTLDTHLRGRDSHVARFGIVIDTAAQHTTIEVGLDGSRPIRQVVRDIQAAVLQALDQAEEPEASSKAVNPAAGHDTGHNTGQGHAEAVEPQRAHQRARRPGHDADTRPRPSVTVRVQSLSA
ncbi:transcriptional regulator [Actinomyces capricornis]|uniref:Transcriptional regulator n=1 Tax=Actinomyces capricornis TaxID=2755559 RepID=A0ABN6K2P6_9ACTO|nr:transcriptional regulator [Actinomyces capricornis]BDA63871.1 hypothetical protein MANAM107_07050 [Actinomyces capricornis]